MNISGKTNKKSSINTLYWKCQFLGWCAVSTYWAYTVYTRDGYGVLNTFINYVLDVLLGISLTHLYRAFALKSNWNILPLKKLLVRVIPSIVVLAILYAFLGNLKWYGYWTFISETEKSLIDALLYWDPILITGLRLMSIWILAYHLYHFYLKELTTAKENAQLSLIAKQTQLDNLSAQLNPHFLFNSLNSIKSLVIESPDTARRAIDLLSDLLRSSLYEKDKDLISIKQELALVKDYVEIEKMRYEERLRIEFRIDKTLEKFKIPTLSIQLLVENAIKHGIDKLIKGGLVVIAVSKKNEQVYIQVQNPGKFEVEGSKGVGLRNLKERLKIQYKNTAFFNLTEIDTNTVEAIIILPFKANENI